MSLCSPHASSSTNHSPHVSHCSPSGISYAVRMTFQLPNTGCGSRLSTVYVVWPGPWSVRQGTGSVEPVSSATRSSRVRLARFQSGPKPVSSVGISASHSVRTVYSVMYRVVMSELRPVLVVGECFPCSCDDIRRNSDRFGEREHSLNGLCAVSLRSVPDSLTGHLSRNLCVCLHVDFLSELAGFRACRCASRTGSNRLPNLWISVRG